MSTPALAVTRAHQAKKTTERQLNPGDLLLLNAWSATQMVEILEMR
ncbi:hypothetical protein [Leifsonia shinshuensis]|nr:hypothetical protein [Leifsonia shinshuensis]MDR6972702.1 hypothetical protein [Leifsonia shinshuensis]